MYACQYACMYADNFWIFLHFLLYKCSRSMEGEGPVHDAIMAIKSEIDAFFLLLNFLPYQHFVFLTSHLSFASMLHLNWASTHFAVAHVQMQMLALWGESRNRFILAELKPFFLKMIRTFERKTGMQWKHWPQLKNCCRTEWTRLPRL